MCPAQVDYDWAHRQPSRRAKQQAALDKTVCEQFAVQKQRYGAPRLEMELNEQGHRC